MKSVIQKPVIKERYLWVDLIRVIATFAVVAIHVNADFICSWNKIPWVDWWVSDIYSAVTHFAVPVFIILSGYLLLDKQEDDWVFFSKRFDKVVIPLVAWSMIYWIVVNNYNVFSVFTIGFVRQFLADTIYYHLYFLYIIIGLYIFTPLLRRILANAKMHDIYYFLILWFLFTPFRQLIGLFGYNFEIPLEATTGYLGYYITGYAIKKTPITDKIIYLSGIMAVTSIIGTIVGSYILSINSGRFESFFISGLSITTVVYSICLFIFLRKVLDHMIVSTAIMKIKNIISNVAVASMGIYLIHPILLLYVSNGLFGAFLLPASFPTPKVLSPIIYVPLVTVLLVVVSLIIVIIMQKIPLIKKIVP
ncbi:acyltransferase [Methanosarcina sp. 2.H.A.1B.4]|uniref:acyltransferase n=1 Tax=Methanosarcina sp. 2.H.A.1B.4 TaxID=1483600 RepID=UPI0006221ACA|nr:acyltransferase family protein [Methanosarcina sp. 2.H.A.1B.4]KKG11026.1 hypothetical protein EO92_11765 [Methanosarcina sp. 2.H.A.1B.4]